MMPMYMQLKPKKKKQLTKVLRVANDFFLFRSFRYFNIIRKISKKNLLVNLLGTFLNYLE